MSKLLAGLGGNTGAVTAGVVVVGVLALGAWIGSKRDTSAVITPLEVTQTQPEVSDGASDVAVEQTVPATKDIPEVVIAVPVEAPAFDEVRREADGMTVVAGRAEPGAVVKLMKDGVEIATTTADGSGKFATLAMIAPDGAGHVLTLIQSVDGNDMHSSDEIILAPIVAPVVVTEVAPEAAETAPLATTPEPKVKIAETPEKTNAPDTEVAVTSDEAPEKPQDVPTAQTEEVDTSKAPLESAEDESPAQNDATPADDIVVAAASEESAPQTLETTKQATPDTPAAETPAEDVNATPAPSPTADAKVAVLKSTAEGVELLNPTAPEVMDTVALDTISYSDAGDVQLSGRAQTDTQTVRIYLDNAAVINLPVDDQGRWRGDVPDVDEGIYTLRVDEVGSDGTVTSRVETPFKREAPAVLAQAAAAQDGPLKAITVQAGATLWAIARDRYGDGKLYVRVFEANEDSIRDPDLIYPGQVFDLPE